MEALSSPPNAVLDAFLGTLFTWAVTALGAGLVFLVPRSLAAKNEKSLLDAALGFASGVMTAASFFSLLQPAIEAAEPEWGHYAFIPASIGFTLGAGFVLATDALLPDIKPVDLVTSSNTSKDADSDDKLLKASRQRARTWRRLMLMILAVTAHNAPEGMAVGVAFAGTNDRASAISLTIGIGLQNFPEGLSVSLPLLRLGYSRWKSFFYGQLSGAVEPVFGVLGALLITLSKPLLPYALCFATGAMMTVVVDDLIPETSANDTDSACDGDDRNGSRVPVFGFIIGFVVMMSLDVGLG